MFVVLGTCQVCGFSKEQTVQVWHVYHDATQLGGRCGKVTR